MWFPGCDSNWEKFGHWMWARLLGLNEIRNSGPPRIHWQCACPYSSLMSCFSFSPRLDLVINYQFGAIEFQTKNFPFGFDSVRPSRWPLSSVCLPINFGIVQMCGCTLSLSVSCRSLELLSTTATSRSSIKGRLLTKRVSSRNKELLIVRFYWSSVSFRIWKLFREDVEMIAY